MSALQVELEQLTRTFIASIAVAFITGMAEQLQERRPAKARRAAQEATPAKRRRRSDAGKPRLKKASKPEPAEEREAAEVAPTNGRSSMKAPSWHEMASGGRA